MMMHPHNIFAGMTSPHFSFDEAFARNLGLITAAEQVKLRESRVAIVGLGGVGGHHLLTLTRMGVTRFAVAEFDAYELPNFNRQVGANMATLGRPKADVMIEMARAINPELDIRLLSRALSVEDFPDFMRDVDVLVDGLDFFVLDLRAQLFSYCHKNRISFVTAGPIGAGTAWLVGHPDGMSPDRYFRFDQARNQGEKAVHFLLGLTPRLLQRSHVVDFSYVNFKQKRGPSLSPSCMACAAIVGVEVMKLLLARGKVRALPWAHQFDMLNLRYVQHYNFMGLNSPYNRLKRWLLARKLGVSRDSA